MANEIKTVEFFKGGNATFTVANPAGEHYTYRINQGKKDRDGKPTDNGPYFTSLLTGPDNNASYTYMGMFNPDSLIVYPTKASKLNIQSKPWKVLAWAIARVQNAWEIPEGYSIQHEGKCCACGRKLTTPESIDLGIGPECAKKRGV